VKVLKRERMKVEVKVEVKVVGYSRRYGCSVRNSVCFSQILDLDRNIPSRAVTISFPPS
jgi:hypothetical protein